MKKTSTDGIAFYYSFFWGITSAEPFVEKKKKKKTKERLKLVFFFNHRIHWQESICLGLMKIPPNKLQNKINKAEHCSCSSITSCHYSCFLKPTSGNNCFESFEYQLTYPVFNTAYQLTSNLIHQLQKSPSC